MRHFCDQCKSLTEHSSRDYKTTAILRCRVCGQTSKQPLGKDSGSRIQDSAKPMTAPVLSQKSKVECRTSNVTPRAAFDFPAKLTEKYQPRTFKEFLALDKPKKVFENFCKAPRPDAFLFIGQAGSGKTTFAQALAARLGAELHHIAARECTADVVREVANFCRYVPLGGGFHLILADEIDQASPAAQVALLSYLDSTEALAGTIWIFTCNSTRGLADRFLSRCKQLEFATHELNGSLTSYLAKIWKAETGKARVPTAMLDEIAHSVDGNVRDALNRLEVEIMAA